MSPGKAKDKASTVCCLTWIRTSPSRPGKTFIAAVVMLNYYRWFPSAKIIFMAPTRPLVQQQVQACHQVRTADCREGSEGLPLTFDAAQIAGISLADIAVLQVGPL
jgi:ERCC4-related helicase